MSQQIIFFKKNKADLDNIDVNIVITDTVATDNGQAYVDFMRNRNNNSAWFTTGSTDAANTQIDIDFVEGRDVTDIILTKHNWKAFTIQYWTGSSFIDFSTAISETVNTDQTSHFNFDSVETSAIRIIITGTQVVDDDKQLFQFIATNRIGQLTGWPEIINPEHDTNKRINKMLSGKVNVVESISSFSCRLRVKRWTIATDLSIVETLYTQREGFIVWLCGGDETQFLTKRIGYRLEDTYLMRATDDYSPKYVQGIYKLGLSLNINLRESIN